MMSESQEWINTFKLSSEDLGKLHTVADPSLSLLHTVLLEKYIPEEEYLRWAANKYLLPQINNAFSTKVIDSEALDRASGLFPWRQDIFPVGLWGNTLYLLCHEPSAVELQDYRVQYVLAPASQMKEIWSEIKGFLQSEPAPATQDEQTAAAPQVTNEAPESGSTPIVVSANGGAQMGSVPAAEETQTAAAGSVPAAEEGQTAAAAPDGVQLGSVPEAGSLTEAPEGIQLGSVTEAAPVGISLSSVPGETAAGEAPEGLGSLAGSGAEGSEAPAGLNFGSLAQPPSEADQGSSVPAAEAPEGVQIQVEGSSNENAPLGISLEASAPELNFGSLINPVRQQEAASAPQESVPQPEAAPAADAQPASVSENVTSAASSQPAASSDESPLLNLSKMLEEDPPQEGRPTPKVSPALSALKVDPKKAADLPPIPQPFGGPSPANGSKNPAASAAPSEQAPAPAAAAQTTAAAPASTPAPAAQGPLVAKSEWSFTEVSKVTQLKQDSQTISRTLEFTHLTASGSSADLESCKAVSDDEVSKAIDDPRKAGNIAEVALNSFKTMKTYFPDAIFFVFLGSSLIPWRWTQNWSRSLETPPGPVDLSTPSIFRIAFQTGLPYHGYVVPSPVNEAFFKTWNNGVLPDHVTLMPIKIGNLVAGMIMGRADRSSLDYKYSLKYMEGLSVNISQALQDISVKSAS